MITEELYRGKILSLHLERLNKKSIAYEVVRKKSVVSVVPILPSGKVVMVSQYRQPMGKKMWEFPAGHIDEGETADQAAARELKEETGYTAEMLIPMGPPYAVSPGFTDEMVTFYLATKLKKGKANPDQGENIKVSSRSISKVVETSGLKTMAGILLAIKYLDVIQMGE